MRTMVLLAVTATALASCSIAGAQEYPWCARYADDNGGTNCGFSTLEQCRAALSGNGGICDANLFYTPPSPPAVAKTAQPPKKKN
jgi:hypothetical protein